MNWCLIISGFIIVVLKVVGMTLFLLYFPQIFGENNTSFNSTGSYGTVPQIFGENNASFNSTGSYGTVGKPRLDRVKCLVLSSPPGSEDVPQIFGTGNSSFIPTESYGTVCPKRWDFHQGRCFFLSTSEMSWNKSRDACEAEESTLAIVNTPEKLEFLQRITGTEKYFIGLLYQYAEKRWRWINNSIFSGSVTNQLQNFNCVTIGLTKTFDAVSCDTPYRWICEKRAQ